MDDPYSLKEKIMRRFYAPRLEREGCEMALDKTESHHLRDVLRITPGARVVVFDGSGLEAEATVEVVNRDVVTLKTERARECAADPSVKITLIQALLKGAKNDLIVEKATELGISEIRFYESGRSVKKLDERRARTNLARWQGVALSAVKQCGRASLPIISGPTPLGEALSGSSDLKIMLHEREEKTGLKTALANITKGGVTLLVGPEGGLSEEESNAATLAGFKSVTLGERTLRAETAPIAALAAIAFETGELG